MVGPPGAPNTASHKFPSPARARGRAYPHYCCDDDGKGIWEMAVGFLEQKQAGEQDQAHELAWHGAAR